MTTVYVNFHAKNRQILISELLLNQQLQIVLVISYSYMWYHFIDKDIFLIKVYFACIWKENKPDKIILENDGQFCSFVLVVQTK